MLQKQHRFGTDKVIQNNVHNVNRGTN